MSSSVDARAPGDKSGSPLEFNALQDRDRARRKDRDRAQKN